MPCPTRILLVEDNPDDVAHVRRVLRKCGIPEELSVARDGKEAIDLLADAAGKGTRPLPDLVILDLNLPQISGLEVLQWIRADQRLLEIPVVVLTGTAEDGQVLRMHHLGVLGYFVKPLQSPEFLRMIAGTSSFAVR